MMKQSRGHHDQSRGPSLKNDFNPRWIKNGLDEKAIEFAEKSGKILSEKMSTSQIRNFFGELKRIQMKGLEYEKTNFHLLRPKLAYAAKRADKREVFEFKDLLEMAHKEVKPEERNAESRFNNYVDLLESILAYHKAHGGN